MIKSILFSALLIVALVTCKSHKASATKNNASLENTSPADTTAVAKPSIQRFIVSFYSIGSGAEGKQMGKLRAFVTEFEKQVGKTITYTTTPWGREGEIDFCFPLKELTDDQQKQFIRAGKDSLQTARFVHYFENAPCNK